MANKTDFNLLLFNNFEALDAFGPADVISKLDELYQIKYFSISGGLIRSAQESIIETLDSSKIRKNGILLIPGGIGTRTEADDVEFIRILRDISEHSSYVLTVCTGTALLARTGLLKGHNATTNKLAFNWVIEQDKQVNWIKKARWVVDGKYYTSSGVSAGIDMTLGFISDKHGEEISRRIARRIEYIWNSNKENDPFEDNAVVLGSSK